MKGNPFYIVDVFAEEQYAGNQLAVVRQAASLSDQEMQKIAREINFSETSFILSETEREGGFDVRIFTPQQEIPFAGHPTLGTAFILQQEIFKRPVKEIVLNLKVGPIPVAFTYRKEEPDVLWMKQMSPRFGRKLEAAEVAPILGLETGEIEPNFPVEEVSTGLPFLIVPLPNLQAIRKSRVNLEKCAKLVEKLEAKAFLLFSPETLGSQNDLHVRVFAHYYGVPEDPATGSANGCLAGYLVKNRYYGSSGVDIRVEQGHEIGRPSLLFLKAEQKEDQIEVLVGGRAFLVARGTLV